VLYWGEVCCELSYGLSGADGVPFWLMRTGNNSLCDLCVVGEVQEGAVEIGMGSLS
jgi:hypothetical protein